MLVCDTSVVYAALDSRDRAHAACRALLGATSEGVAVPAPIVVEVDWIGRARGRPDAGAVLLRGIDNGDVLLVNLDEHDYRRSRDLLCAYHDLPLEFVDAAVIAVAERLGETTIATLDRRHFSVVMPAHCEAFTLVP